MRKSTYLVFFFFFILLVFSILCGGCGKTSPAPESTTPPPAAEPTSEPTPEPTPFVEPEMEDTDITVYFDGILLPGGAKQKDDIVFVLLSEVADALDTSYTHEKGSSKFSLSWRKDSILLSADENSAVYLGTGRPLDSAPILCSGGDDLYVPVESFCQAAEIGFYPDTVTSEEAEHVTYYCTPGAGDWAVPENYNVPVLMYHGVGHASFEANLILTPESLEEQIVYMLDHGFTPIWFEDLWHVEDFEKPVIMMFDDGWGGTHKYLLPLVEQYHVKASVAIVKDISNFHGQNGSHLTLDMIDEMLESPYIRFESHGVTHNALDQIPQSSVDGELSNSERWVTQVTKKEPCTFVYPIGGSTPYAQEQLLRYYKFGVKMTHPDVIANIANTSYNTSDDPTLVWRFFVQKQTSLSQFSAWLEDPFLDPNANNSVISKIVEEAAETP